jgi:surfeit locus 1 family protein
MKSGMTKNELVKWTLSSILVILGVFVLIRLGFWQLDRLDQRREFNDHYLTQISAKPIDLNLQPIPIGLEEMEYREIFVSGYYDFDNEIYLQNQAYQNEPGYRVVTPLRIDNSESVVYIERGWISFTDYENMEEINKKYDQKRSIHGIIRNPESNDKIIESGTISDNQQNLYLYVDINSLQTKIDYDLLPIYIQQNGEDVDGKPIPQIAEIEISEGPHFGYAIQWFFFASLLGFGYPFFVRKQLNEKNRESGNEENI